MTSHLLYNIIVEQPDVTVGDPGQKSVMLSWESLLHYEVSFERSPAAGSLDRQTRCAGFEHEDTIDVGMATEYTLNDLEEDSVYNITVTAFYVGGSVSNEEVITTRQAGKISSRYYLTIALLPDYKFY